MPRINLLPWREEERKKRQRDFGVALAGGVVAAVAGILLTMFVFAQMIDNQEARNARLTAEIVELQKDITEIDGLERQKERLLAHKMGVFLAVLQTQDNLSFHELFGFFELLFTHLFICHFFVFF